MRRVPLLATAVVAIAVAAMIALGLWQLLIRAPEKDALVARLARNPDRPPIAFPLRPDDSLLFRRAAAVCQPPVRIARAGAGNAGFRLIARCGGTAAAPRLQVQLGTTRDPSVMVDWRGGPVSGWISHAPGSQPMIARLFHPAPQAMLLVAATPAPGLAPNTRPDAGLVPNNHRAYAGQWFLFAGIAAAIYALAVRRRFRGQAPGRG